MTTHHVTVPPPTRAAFHHHTVVNNLSSVDCFGIDRYIAILPAGQQNKHMPVIVHIHSNSITPIRKPFFLRGLKKVLFEFETSC